MDFTLTEAQQMLRKSARTFLTDACPKSYVRNMETDHKGHSPAAWQKMAELGWQGLAIPDLYGGSGMEFIELAVLLEEMGRACLPAPFFSTVILGALPIMEDGSAQQKAALLPDIAAGKTIFTMAVTEADGLYEADSIRLDAVIDGNDYVLNGTKMFVPDAVIADYLLVAARTGKTKTQGITVFIVPSESPGIKCAPLHSFSGAKLSAVTFENVRVAKTSIIGGVGKGWTIIEKTIERAAAAQCCGTVGMLQKVLEITVDYAKERKQFGKPVGSFQVIQQYLADTAANVDGARFASYQAAWRISQGLPAQHETAVAKLFCSQVFEWNITKAHQIFGAIGVTMDHELHFYTARGKANQLSCGDSEYWQEHLAKSMGLLSFTPPTSRV
jgi:alkylation response protein AidB-like acyl-CoA dehydrogenase